MTSLDECIQARIMFYLGIDDFGSTVPKYHRPQRSHMPSLLSLTTRTYTYVWEVLNLAPGCIRRQEAGPKSVFYPVQVEDDVDGCVEDDDQWNDEADGHHVPRVRLVHGILPGRCTAKMFPNV